MGESRGHSMKNKNLMSIGEVSRIMGVHVKSLRYYDRIGVLQPAWVDPDTGYRYYHPTQLSMVQAIQFCVELGIPLKQFQEYCGDGTINTGQLLEDAAQIAERKIQTIRDGLRFMQNLRDTIERSDLLSETEEPIRFEMPGQRTYILREIARQQEEKQLNELLGELHSRAMELGYMTGFTYGYMYLFQDQSIRRYVFTEVFGTGAADASVLRIEPRSYKAIKVERSSIERSPELFPEEFCAGKCLAVFETEMVTSMYDTQTMSYELRCTGLGPEEIPGRGSSKLCP